MTVPVAFLMGVTFGAGLVTTARHCARMLERAWKRTAAEAEPPEALEQEEILNRLGQLWQEHQNRWN